MSNIFTCLIWFGVMVIVLVPCIIFPILAFVDCLQNPRLTPSTKLAWGCLIFFTWSLGASIYAFAASKRPLFRSLALVVIIGLPACLVLRTQFEKRDALSGAKIMAKQRAAMAIPWPDSKFLFDGYGMSKARALLESGKCDQAAKLLDDPAYYHGMDQGIGEITRSGTIDLAVLSCIQRTGKFKK